MRRVMFLVLLVAAACRTAPVLDGRDKKPPPTAAPDAAVEPGRVSEPPAPTLRLPGTLTAVRYRARLEVDPAQSGFHGELELDAQLAAPASLVWLNADRLTITSATALVGGESIALEPVPLATDFVGLRAAKDLPAGAVTLRLVYDGSYETHDSMGAFVQPVDGAQYVFTQLEALGARRVFPCIDEPSSKVPWTLTLDVPAGQVAVANTQVERDEPNGDGRRVVFRETMPLPTYLVAFAVGPFDVVDAGKTPGGAPIRVLAFAGRGDQAGYVTEATPKIMRILEDYFGTPYPYDKLDLVPIPTTTWFGAMENAGLITFRADIIAHPQWTDVDREAYASYLAHEAAHQWFGNLVTMAWWDDLWLNEAFATWMEEHVMTEFAPAWVADETWVANRHRALSQDGLVSARMIHQPIVEQTDIQSAFDGITYQKGRTVIRMIEHWIGRAAFRDGVRAYLAAHAYGNATSEDFLAAVDAVTDLDVTSVFRTFLDQPGAPRVSATLACADGGSTITLRQDRWLPRGATAPVGAAPRWVMPVCVAHGDGKNARGEVCTTMIDEVQVTSVDGCPAWILPNADATGYYRVGLDAAAIAAVRDRAWSQLTAPERLLFAYEVSAMVERGDLAFGDLLDLTTRLVGPKAGKVSKQARGLAVQAAWGAHGIASDAAAPKVAKWIRGMFGKRAAKLGWLTGANASLELQAERDQLVTLVAIAGEDRKLLAQAAKLARRWPDLPEADRGRVVSAAVRVDAAVRAALISSLRSKDQREVGDAIWGLGGIDDPEAAKPALEALLDRDVDLTQAYYLIGALAGHRKVYPVAVAFLRDHFDELAPRIPEQLLADTVYTFTASCDAADRGPAEAWAQAHLAGALGGPRAIAQALESLDQCVAHRAALGPELDAWLKRRKQ